MCIGGWQGIATCSSRSDLALASGHDRKALSASRSDAPPARRRTPEGADQGAHGSPAASASKRASPCSASKAGVRRRKGNELERSRAAAASASSAGSRSPAAAALRASDQGATCCLAAMRRRAVSWAAACAGAPRAAATSAAYSNQAASASLAGPQAARASPAASPRPASASAQVRRSWLGRCAGASWRARCSAATASSYRRCRIMWSPTFMLTPTSSGSMSKACSIHARASSNWWRTAATLASWTIASP